MGDKEANEGNADARPASKLFEQEAIEAGFQPDEWRGVFLMQGQRLSISEFTISINDEGELTSPGPTLSTGVEMAPYWLEIAVQHAQAAERFVQKTNGAWRTEDAQAQSKALNAEFKATVQAITAAAFAVDAFYSTILEAAPVPQATMLAWQRNHTRRSRRVFETIRRNFRMPNSMQSLLKEFLDKLFSFRDQAVHPTSKTRQAKKHPRLPVSVDDAFSIFRARNAWTSVGMVVDLLQSMASKEKSRPSALAERMEPMKKLIDPIASKWRRSAAGKRFERERSGS